MSGPARNLRDPEGTGEKRCNGCGVYFPLDHYGVKTHRKDGSEVWQTRCGGCRHGQQSAAQRARRARLAMSTSPVDLEPVVHLPIAPLRDWLRARIASPEFDHATLSIQLGCDQRQVSRWLLEQTTVTLDIVDAALCRFGSPCLLRELYPELFVFPDEEVLAA